MGFFNYIQIALLLPFATVSAAFSGEMGVKTRKILGSHDRPLALVYRGAGSCQGDLCPEAAAAVAEQAGMRVRFVAPDQIAPEIFEGASAWIQPGGNAISVSQKLGREKLALIRKFIRYGGAYVGFCAGAFLADRTVDNPETVEGLGLLPVGTFDYPVDSGDAGIPMVINWGGSRRTLFFNGGGSFRMNDRGAERMDIIATFPNGDAATVETTYGLGGVVVTGAHPEALEIWKQDAKFEDLDGSDIDLAVSMVHRALSLSLSLSEY